ncbi:hypothetical protein [Psychrobacter sp. FDAARGOS_221]|uniref:hypothetical protein n=1 Tax=Psychrobacter sp. FDAARGOS_221 TaxID=1975705 RepID=UPI000BB58B88|nr:hypothetical protein [Psychrobacter sp. FDAARGOS_221]PNK60791.1 hypothetical protein A6J60_007810 [Psychrobacter sp. FDAARGOS_221]
MNLNLSTLGLILALISMIGQIWELVCMGKKKEFLLLGLTLVFIVAGSFYQVLGVALLAIKVIFYSRYWSEKSIRKPLYLQLAPMVVALILFGIVLTLASGM